MKKAVKNHLAYIQQKSDAQQPRRQRRTFVNNSDKLYTNGIMMYQQIYQCGIIAIILDIIYHGYYVQLVLNFSVWVGPTWSRPRDPAVTRGTRVRCAVHPDFQGFPRKSVGLAMILGQSSHELHLRSSNYVVYLQGSSSTVVCLQTIPVFDGCKSLCIFREVLVMRP